MKRGRRVAILALLGAALLLGAPSGASAMIARLSTGRTLSYQPLRHAAFAQLMPADQLLADVEYEGGPVMASNTNYAFYWDPSGGSAYPAEYQLGVDQYFEDLAADSGGAGNVESVSAQYNDAAGQFARYDSRFGGAIVDEDPYPPNGCSQAPTCLTDAQLRAELTSYISAHGLPADLTHEYFVLTPPGVESCFEASGHECSAGAQHGSYCAYHSYTPLGGGEVIYTDNPYVTGNEGCDDGNHPNDRPSDGVIEGGLAHEHNESITDPEPNSGWLDLENGDEIADKCRDFEEASEFGPPLGTAPDGARYNQLIDGHPYWYQQMWSNQGQRCMQRLSFNGEEPTATFTSTPGSGDEVEFDASASSAPGGVARYDWQFDDGPGQGAPVDTASATITHVFHAAGPYLVALSVFAADGTSIGAAQTVAAGQPPTPLVQKLSPKDGPAAGGTSVKITGSNLSGATAVDFGASAAQSFTVTSPTSILAVSPVASGGTVDVTVTTASATSPIVAADRFTYGGPVVSGVSPSSGPRSSATIVTITGTGFAVGSGVTSFKFGTRSTTLVNCTSSSTCTALAPMGARNGKVDVTAKVGKTTGRKNPPADQFTYQ